MVAGAAIGQVLRIWRAKRTAHDGDESGQSVAQEGNLHGAVLGTLGLLLAFSFGMVLERYEDRRALAIQEADAIEMAYLRAQILDEPHRSRLSNLLLEYTANRIDLSSVNGEGGAFLEKNDRLLTEIWAGVRAARESALADGMTTTLLIAFNDVIDLDSDRKIAWELRLPVDVLTLLLAYLVITTAVIGYQIDGPRGRRAALALFMLIALSIAFIADINRPQSGSEPESQEPLIMLLASLRAQPPPVFDQFETGEGEGRR
jgi:hypothetical protein